jgi:hypothetical protein
MERNQRVCSRYLNMNCCLDVDFGCPGVGSSEHHDFINKRSRKAAVLGLKRAFSEVKMPS